MKNFKKILLLALIISLSTSFVFADDIPVIDPPLIDPPIVTPPTPTTVNIHLKISTNSGSLYDNNLDVSSCESDNPTSGILKITAYCAVLQSGLTTDWNTAWAPGIFLNSINNIAGSTTTDVSGNPVYHYWSWASNGTDGTVGLNEYLLQPNDSITLTFIDPVEPPVITADPVDPTPTKHSGGGGYVAPKTKAVFNINKAYEFLISQQKDDGTFGGEMYTDWATLALMNSEKYQNEKIKLIKNFTSTNPTNNLLTDIERHTMALMALGLNPYNTNGENYIKKITDSYDGKQFGDIKEINDDIFALIILQNAGYIKEDEMIKNTIAFVLSKQNPDGSFSNNVDMTGAGIEAMVFMKDDPIIKNALENAEKYLKQNQKADGGFGNVSATAWAIQGILALGEKPADWKIGDNSPFDYLGQNQDTDGGIKTDDMNNKIWQTSYALTSVSEKTWLNTMQKFSTPSLASDRVKTENIQTVKTIQHVKKIIKTNSITPSNLTASVVETQNLIPKQEVAQNKPSWIKRILSSIFGF